MPCTRTRDIQTCCQAFGNGPVTNCFNDESPSREGLNSDLAYKGNDLPTKPQSSGSIKKILSSFTNKKIIKRGNSRLMLKIEPRKNTNDNDSLLVFFTIFLSKSVLFISLNNSLHVPTPIFCV